MSASREAKRARQACANCRRKKTRCSGEKPICSFCARLGQECIYRDEPYSVSVDLHRPRLNASQDANLAARVALLESKLSLLDSNALNKLFNTQVDAFSESSPDREEERASSNQATSSISRGEPNSKFSTVPPLEVLQSICDVYFAYCHNQPYSYFHEAAFRQRLVDGSLPSYLLLAVMAHAARFSEDPFFEGRQRKAVDMFANAAWEQIFEHCFTSDDALTVATVQATNTLAIVDFTSGRNRQGWVRIGLSVRFAQGLQLNLEPDPQLALWEQEERRRTFWSVYLLDRLVSVGRHRPPVLNDIDCTVRLPMSEEAFRAGSPSLDIPSLSEMAGNAQMLSVTTLDQFALVITMASALGQILRYDMKPNPGKSQPPWDFESDFARIYSSLMDFETRSPLVFTSLPHAIRQDFTHDGVIDQQRTGHLIYAQVLYHLNQILLNHPFLLSQKLQACQTRIPPSFLRESTQRCQSHAKILIQIIREVESMGTFVETSFYAYCVIVAGVIHRLYENHSDDTIRREASEGYRYCVEFLENHTHWPHYPRIAKTLKTFRPLPTDAAKLIAASSDPQSYQLTDVEYFWSILDYGWLSDSARATDPPSDADPSTGSREPSIFDSWIVNSEPELNPNGNNAESETPLPPFGVDKSTGAQPSLGQNDYMRHLLGEDMGAVWSLIMNDREENTSET